MASLAPAEAGTRDHDFIVVGAGSAGAALASRLSRSGRHSVLLLEAGRDDGWLVARVPALVSQPMMSPRMNWQFYTEPEPGFADRRIYWPRGRAFGGTSAINGMIWVRGDPAEFDHWRDLGNVGWGSEDVMPVFRRIEDYRDGDPVTRGRSGPVTISRFGPSDPLSDAFISACDRLGVPANPDYNVGAFEGAGYLQYNTRRGVRWSTREAYLRPARRRPNLTIVPSAMALRIRFEGRRAAGVTYLANGHMVDVKARREVVLCCGTVQSPQLLEVSGIGDPHRLAQHGIAVVSARPGVGENLRDHANARMNFECTHRGTLNDAQHHLLWRLRMGLRWLATGRGLVGTIGSVAHALARTDPTLNRADAKIQIVHMSSSDVSREGKIRLDPFPGFSIASFALRPESAGSIHIRSPDATEPPTIRANYLTDPRDVATALRAARLVRRIAGSEPLQRFVVCETRPGPDTRSDDEMLAWIRSSALTSYHPVGTCRMGRDDMAVVDERLRVHGVTGLRVADASIMPTMVSSNTNAPSVMIGEKAADMILADVGDTTGEDRG